LRKVLVVSQFSISLVLIKATLVVFRQLEFMQAKSLGLNKEQVVTLNFYGPLAGKYDAFYNELTANPAVKNVARSSRLPSGRLLDSFGQAKLQMGADTLEPTQVDLKFVTIDHRFFPLYDIGMEASRTLVLGALAGCVVGYFLTNILLNAIFKINNGVSGGALLWSTLGLFCLAALAAGLILRRTLKSNPADILRAE